MVYLLLGANEGERLSQLREARRRIEKRVGEALIVSSVYASAPWGASFCGERVFLNQALGLATRLGPLPLLKEALTIEKEMGRDRQRSPYARPIDIDILLYENRVINHRVLCVPHPRLTERRFALTPLAEIAAGVIHPQRRRSIQDLLDDCPDALAVMPYRSTNEEGGEDRPVLWC